MKISKYIASALMLAACLSVTSCDDWTEPESIDLNYGTIENADPAAYQKYLANLREYRNLPHKKVYTWFNNLGAAFGSQGHRISAVPDSVDVVVLNNPEQVTNQMIQEMYDARVNKGQQFSYAILFDDIRADYVALCEELAAKRNAFITANGDDAEIPAELLDPDFIEYVGDAVTVKLSYFNTVGFDCLMAGFTGKSTLHMTPAELKEYNKQANAFLGIIIDWLGRNSDVKLDFYGRPQYVDADFCSKIRYAFLSESYSATNSRQYSIFLGNAGNALAESQYGMVASMPDVTGADGKLGYYSDGTLAINGLALWTAINPVGAVGVFNTGDDYFLTGGKYTNVRQLIQTVNPAAK